MHVLTLEAKPQATSFMDYITRFGHDTGIHDNNSDHVMAPSQRFISTFGQIQLSNKELNSNA